MNLQEVMSQLESLGTEQNRKTYKRHGCGENVFGVSFENLKKLAKKIKTDHALACQLWNTKNVDARSLCTMILDPNQLDEKTASSWMAGLDYYGLILLLSGCFAQSNFVRNVINSWTDSDDEYIRQCGYDTLSCFLKGDNDLTNRECQKFIDKIEREINTAPNRAKHAMNTALIAIGVYKPDLTDAALQCADRMGKVVVDHGDTSCKTPDARAYILKALSKKKARVGVC